MVSVWYFFLALPPNTHHTMFGFDSLLSFRQIRDVFLKNVHRSQLTQQTPIRLVTSHQMHLIYTHTGTHKNRMICMPSNQISFNKLFKIKATFISHNNKIKQLCTIRRKNRRCVNVKTKPRKTNILFLPYSVRRAFFYEV